MYYEEKLINGVMHWRGNPNDEFQPYTLEQLSQRYAEAAGRASRMYGVIGEAIEMLRQSRVY